MYKIDLLAFIKNHSEAIPSDIIMKIASDIASGMNMMNSVGIVHRDLKSFSFLFFSFFFLIMKFFWIHSFSFFLLINKTKNHDNRSNILLENKESKLNAVICDFGLARVQETEVLFLSISFLFFWTKNYYYHFLLFPTFIFFKYRFKPKR